MYFCQCLQLHRTDKNRYNIFCLGSIVSSTIAMLIIPLPDQIHTIVH